MTMKFQKGQKVRITTDLYKDKSDGPVLYGQILTFLETGREGGWSWFTKEDGKRTSIWNKDAEPVAMDIDDDGNLV